MVVLAGHEDYGVSATNCRCCPMRACPKAAAFEMTYIQFIGPSFDSHSEWVGLTTSRNLARAFVRLTTATVTSSLHTPEKVLFGGVTVSTKVKYQWRRRGEHR
jgi:hypothetical protein